MKNKIERQVTRHSLPVQMCFNVFFPPYKNFEMRSIHEYLIKKILHEEIQPAHIAHFAKATRSNATSKALSKCAILPEHDITRLQIIGIN